MENLNPKNPSQREFRNSARRDITSLSALRLVLREGTAAMPTKIVIFAAWNRYAGNCYVLSRRVFRFLPSMASACRVLHKRQRGVSSGNGHSWCCSLCLFVTPISVLRIFFCDISIFLAFAVISLHLKPFGDDEVSTGCAVS